MNQSDISKANYAKLEDILNSQESIMEKIGVLQVELFNHPDKVLENQLDDLSTIAGSTYAKIKEVTDVYEGAHKQELQN